MIAPEVLLESKTARDGQLTQVSHSAASDVLSKAKALVFALWQGTGAATTEQMAEYYEIDTEAVQSVLRRHRDELEPDGLKVLRGKKVLDFVTVNMTVTNKARNLTIWTPRAALRLGMLLRDSEVAKQVRTVLLDVAQTAEPHGTSDSQQVRDDITQMVELAKIQAQTINEQSQALKEQQKLLTAALANLSKGKAKEKKQPKWTPRTTSHLSTFMNDAGLEINPDNQIDVYDLWLLLRDWYIKTGVLKIRTVRGKEESIWSDLPSQRDIPVKAINRVYKRFQEVFPKLKKRVHTQHHEGVSLGRRYLIGIGYAQAVSEGESYD